MNDIEQKALAMVNEVLTLPFSVACIDRDIYSHEALCRAIEHHEAFKQEVSDIVYAYVNATEGDGESEWKKLNSLII
jgi:hypothetical protein